MANVGYGRVSTADQNLDSQVAALKRAGCTVIFTEKRSGAKRDRPELARALESLQRGDTFVVYKLSRAARSLPHLLEIVAELKERDVTFVSLTEAIDTSTMAGRLMLNIIGSIDEFLRELIIEHTNAGLEAARARGHVSGPPPYGLGPDHTSIIEDEAALLRAAARRILDKEPISHVVDDWNDRKLTTRQGGRWGVTSLRTLLLNPRVAPILGQDVHGELGRLLRDPDRQHLGRPAQHLASGILRCGICTQPLYGGHVQGDRWVYRCRKAQGSGGRFRGCGGVTISLPRADDAVRDLFIAAIVGDGSKLPQYVAAQAKALQQGGPTPDQLAQEAEELGELEAVLGTRFGTAEHWQRATELEARATAAQARMRQAPDLAALAGLPRTESKLQAAWKGWTTPERRIWLRRVFECVVVAPAPAGTHHRGSNVGARLDPQWKL